VQIRSIWLPHDVDFTTPGVSENQKVSLRRTWSRAVR